MPESDPDADRLRVARRIAEIDERLIAIDAEIADLQASAIGRLRKKIDDAKAQGWDLFGEMILQVKREVARAAEGEGADILSLVNTFVGMAVDVERRRSVLANMSGGLSGPAIRPLAVWMTWQVYRTVKIPIVGMGGILEARDALEFILAGASAVQVGTANFIRPDAAVHVLDGLQQWLVDHRVSTVTELVGTLRAEADG